MPSSAAASTTGSTTPSASANSRSCAPACRARPSGCRSRSSPSSSACARVDPFQRAGHRRGVDWAKALVALDTIELSPEDVRDTLGVLLKHRDDIVRMQGDEVTRLLAELQRTARPSQAAPADVR